MEIRTDILNELREISPVVAGIGNLNVYEIPAGYFEPLADLIMNRINTSENSQTKNNTDNELTLINAINKEGSFTIPEGYFEGFADKMMSRIKSEQQIISVSEELATISSLLNSLNKEMPYSVPANYFNELAGNLVSGSKAAEFINEGSEELSSLMSSLKNKNVYQIPEDYFDNFSGNVLNKINQPQAKIISFNKKKSWLKYAAAAVVIGVIGTAGFLFFNNHVPANNISNQASASNINNTDPIQGLAKVSDDEMLNYLEDQSTPPASAEASPASIASTDINENDAKDLLSDIPDDELQKYIDDDVNSKDLIN